MPDTNRQHPTCARRPAATCEHIVGRLSDYERGLWTPAPGESVSIATASGELRYGTFIGVSDHRAFVVVDDLVLEAAADWFQTYRWDELAPAPPIGCECEACHSDEQRLLDPCEACDCGACPFVHECGCAQHGCGCPAGGCAGAPNENRSGR
jgi:hypothetical protein